MWLRDVRRHATDCVPFAEYVLLLHFAAKDRDVPAVFQSQYRRLTALHLVHHVNGRIYRGFGPRNQRKRYGGTDDAATQSDGAQ